MPLKYNTFAPYEIRTKPEARRMNIAIIGTRGIPNHYGGFEQFAEYLSVGLVKQGHTVTVYNTKDHPYQEKVWNGVNIVHFKDPYFPLKSLSQFAYDLSCILDCRGKNFDIILQLGYTSSTVWGWLLPRKKSIVTTNMDGLEWKRTKYNKPVQRFLRFAEKLGVKYSDYLISDSLGIQKHLKNTYGKSSTFIPYGANLFTKPDISVLVSFALNAGSYNMLVARMEPENNVELILDAVVASGQTNPFLVVGNHLNGFGAYLATKFKSYSFIKFTGSIYDIKVLNNLRHFSKIYFHGHTVGGTNPSLLEAMASQALICAHDNIFNKSIVGTDGIYFATKEDIMHVLHNTNKSNYVKQLANNENKITTLYSWPIIINQYEQHFKQILQQKTLSLAHS